MPVDLGRFKRKASRAVSVVSGPIAARLALPEGRFPAAHDWVADLRSLRWLDDDRFELAGWAYDRDIDYTGTQPSGAATHLVGAILYHGDEAWFFKLSGPDATVATQKTAFLDFLKTVKAR